MNERGRFAPGPDVFNVVSCRLRDADESVEGARHRRLLLPAQSNVTVGLEVGEGNSVRHAVVRCQACGRRVLDLLGMIVDASLEDCEWFGSLWIAWWCICRRTPEEWITPTPGQPGRRELARRLVLLMRRLSRTDRFRPRAGDGSTPTLQELAQHHHGRCSGVGRGHRPLDSSCAPCRPLESTPERHLSLCLSYRDAAHGH